MRMEAVGDLGQIARQIQRDMAQDVTIAVTAATRGAVTDMRQEIGRAFPASRRIATLVTGKAEPSQPNRFDLNAAGRVYGRGGKLSTWPAPLWAQAFGARIAPSRRQALAVPTQRVPRDGRNRALTPAEVETRFGQKLEFVPAGRFGKAACLVLTDRPLTRAGRVGRRREHARRKPNPVVMFWLIRSATLRPRFDPVEVMTRWAGMVPDLIDRAKRARESVQGSAR